MENQSEQQSCQCNSSESNFDLAYFRSLSRAQRWIYIIKLLIVRLSKGM